MMSEVSRNLTTMDIYELASVIGNEFEKLINIYGRQSVIELMPKVINVLEHLEQLSIVVQQEAVTISDLRGEVQRLTAEKKAKAEDRLKYENELEQIEECWRSDAKELHSTISKLQDENQKFRSTLLEKTGLDDKLQKAEEERENELLVQIKTLQDSVHRQGEQLRQVQRELGQTNTDLDTAQLEIKRLLRVNKELQHKLQTNGKLTQSLIEETALLKVELHDKHLLIAILSGSQSPHQCRSSSQSMSLSQVSETDSIHNQQTQSNSISSDLQQSKYSAELNELCNESADSDEGDTDEYDPDNDNDDDDDDAPVQGPINKEPEEKLHPDKFQRESGIRKLFVRLFDKIEKLNFTDTEKTREDD